ncbi:hypothetical protein CXF95_06240 [Paraglaciecola sp. MB-3u-78]|nr:hypothetical protein CXF95_06240 [Paraglaciecola sp. MB-3u-78]
MFQLKGILNCVSPSRNRQNPQKKKLRAFLNDFLRLKTLAVSGLSCLLLLAVEKKSVRQYGCCLKKGMDAGVRSTFLTIKFNRI